jgi:hypothetical protein
MGHQRPKSHGRPSAASGSTAVYPGIARKSAAVGGERSFAAMRWGYKAAPNRSRSIYRQICSLRRSAAVPNARTKRISRHISTPPHPL